jgi:hypothetical protein
VPNEGDYSGDALLTRLEGVPLFFRFGNGMDGPKSPSDRVIGVTLGAEHLMVEYCN